MGVSGGPLFRWGGRCETIGIQVRRGLVHHFGLKRALEIRTSTNICASDSMFGGEADFAGSRLASPGSARAAQHSGAVSSSQQSSRFGSSHFLALVWRPRVGRAVCLFVTERAACLVLGARAMVAQTVEKMFNRRFEDLGQASRHLGVSPKLRRQLFSLDTAAALIRHDSEVRGRDLEELIRAELERKGG